MAGKTALSNCVVNGMAFFEEWMEMGDYHTPGRGTMEIIPPEGHIIPPEGCIIPPEAARGRENATRGRNNVARGRYNFHWPEGRGVIMTL